MFRLCRDLVADVLFTTYVEYHGDSEARLTNSDADQRVENLMILSARESLSVGLNTKHALRVLQQRSCCSEGVSML